MLKNTILNKRVIKTIAEGLAELNQRVVYVGGAIVSLYINDPAADDIRPTKDIDISLEIASVSESLGTTSKWIEIAPQDPNRIHPNQKPIKLYEFIFKTYAKENFKIVDTHLGSGNIIKALDKVNKHEKMNLSIVACEIDTDYFNNSIKSIKLETAIQTLF
jgi:DNA modification methylase